MQNLKGIITTSIPKYLWSRHVPSKPVGNDLIRFVSEVQGQGFVSGTPRVLHLDHCRIQLISGSGTIDNCSSEARGVFLAICVDIEKYWKGLEDKILAPQDIREQATKYTGKHMTERI